MNGRKLLEWGGKENLELWDNGSTKGYIWSPNALYSINVNCRCWLWIKWGQTFISIFKYMVWICECVCESVFGQLYGLPFGWNILETNRTVGGLFGYSSENSIRSLNVPAERRGESERGRRRARDERECVCEGQTHNFVRRIQMWRIKGVRESERHNYVTKNTAGSTEREANPSPRQRCRLCRLKGA